MGVSLGTSARFPLLVECELSRTYSFIWQSIKETQKETSPDSTMAPVLALRLWVFEVKIGGTNPAV